MASMKTGHEQVVAKRWSIRSGQFEPDLHLPSAAVIDAALNVEQFLPKEAQLKVAAAGVLISVLQLMNPDLLGDNDAIKQLSQEVGREITNATMYTAEQKQEISGYYASLGVEPAPATKAIGALAEAGLDPEISNLAHNAILLISLKEKIAETGADIKLPQPRIIKD